jgi:hypothetical protein
MDTWDDNGNTISSGGITNTYDFENRMRTHGAVSIVYDGDGNRVSETVGGATHQTAGDLAVFRRCDIPVIDWSKQNQTEEIAGNFGFARILCDLRWRRRGLSS